MIIVFDRFWEFAEHCRHRDGYTCYHDKNLNSITGIGSTKKDKFDSGRLCKSNICPIIICPLRGEKKIAYGRTMKTIFDNTNEKASMIEGRINKQRERLKGTHYAT